MQSGKKWTNRIVKAIKRKETERDRERQRERQRDRDRETSGNRKQLCTNIVVSAHIDISSQGGRAFGGF